MEPPAITTQPLTYSQETETSAAGTDKLLSNLDNNGHIVEKENRSENEHSSDSNKEALLDSDTGHNEVKENEDKRRQQQIEEHATDCCCVYIENGDPFCVQILCHWICDCFRCIGECTDNCFEDCATCLGNCCEDGDGCLECCSGCDDSSVDCVSGCLECCKD